MSSEGLRSINNSALQLLLEKGVVFEGELRFKGTARLNGELKGKISGEGTLIIDSEANVSADIEVTHLILLGRLSGKVIATKQVHMEPPAWFQGEVTSPSLSIKEGVSFEGSSKKPGEV